MKRGKPLKIFSPFASVSLFFTFTKGTLKFDLDSYFLPWLTCGKLHGVEGVILFKVQ